MAKVRVAEAIIVEGRYDKNTLSQLVDALIIETNGFQIFHNASIQRTISEASKRSGIIILTDSDASGFLIRSRIKAFVPESRIRNAYIPDVYGKEKRKSSPGKEGKLGVEGMPPGVLLDALKRAGATIEDGTAPERERITVADLYRAGLTGSEASRARRIAFLHRHALPEHLSTKALADALSRIMTRQEFFAEITNSNKSEKGKDEKP